MRDTHSISAGPLCHKHSGLHAPKQGTGRFSSMIFDRGYAYAASHTERHVTGVQRLSPQRLRQPFGNAYPATLIAVAENDEELVGRVATELVRSADDSLHATESFFEQGISR